MEATTAVNSDGTIPAEIRELYGILEGAKVPIESTPACAHSALRKFIQINCFLSFYKP